MENNIQELIVSKQQRINELSSEIETLKSEIDNLKKEDNKKLVEMIKSLKRDFISRSIIYTLNYKKYKNIYDEETINTSFYSVDKVLDFKINEDDKIIIVGEGVTFVEITSNNSKQSTINLLGKYEDNFEIIMSVDSKWANFEYRVFQSIKILRESSEDYINTYISNYLKNIRLKK